MKRLAAIWIWEYPEKQGRIEIYNEQNTLTGYITEHAGEYSYTRELVDDLEIRNIILDMYRAGDQITPYVVRKLFVQNLPPGYLH